MRRASGSRFFREPRSKAFFLCLDLVADLIDLRSQQPRLACIGLTSEGAILAIPDCRMSRILM